MVALASRYVCPATPGGVGVARDGCTACNKYGKSLHHVSPSSESMWLRLEIRA
jgi:radical SAM superfamily enzyme